MSRNRYQLPGEKKWTHEIEAKCVRPVQDGVQTVKSHGIRNGHYIMYGTRIVSVLICRTQLNIALCNQFKIWKNSVALCMKKNGAIVTIPFHFEINVSTYLENNWISYAPLKIKGDDDIMLVTYEIFLYLRHGLLEMLVMWLTKSCYASFCKKRFA